MQFAEPAVLDALEQFVTTSEFDKLPKAKSQLPGREVSSDQNSVKDTELAVVKRRRSDS